MIIVLTKLIIFLALFNVPLVASNIKAMQVLGNVSDISPTSRAWLSASYQDITLYPKYTSRQDSNISNIINKSKKAKVKAIHDGQNISFLIKWKGDERGVEKEDGIVVYTDGLIIQFPVEYADVTKLPYIDKGNKGRPVVVYLQKKIKATYEAHESIDFFLRESGTQESEEKVVIEETQEHQEVFISEGEGFVTAVVDSSSKMYMIYKNGYWRGTLSRALKQDYLDLDNGGFPISLALLVGDNHKFMSSWIGVKLVSRSGAESLLSALEALPNGDVANGERLALENCASCHRYGDAGIGSDFMGPNLSNIGGYSTIEYLRESILHPNAVIVRGTKKHSWYSEVGEGEKISTMPSYNWLDKKSIDDLVAFFMTQKGA